MRMKVVSNGVVSVEHGNSAAAGQGGDLVCLTKEMVGGEVERDGRGLVIALLLCMTCWAALAYFLLT